MEAWMNFRVRFVVVVVVWCTVVSAWADSQSWRYAENNQRLIDAQKTGGDPSKPGPVTITYYGHMAFKITSPAGLEILIDPWRNDPSGAWGLWFHDEFPGIVVDSGAVDPRAFRSRRRIPAACRDGAGANER
jgi:hypothetical protein